MPMASETQACDSKISNGLAPCELGAGMLCQCGNVPKLWATLETANPGICGHAGGRR